MKVLGIIACACLILGAVPVRAQFFEERSKKEAKQLYDKGMKEDSDRAKQVQDLCQAAKLQPKEKKYVDTCASYRDGLNHDDEALLASAILAFKRHDLEKAESLAGQISSYDPKIVAQAKTVLDAVHNEKASGQSLAQVKAAWDKGDFDGVMTLSQSVTNPAAKAEAENYVKDVNMYNAYIEAADKAMKDNNPDEAKEQLGRAYMLNNNGPTDVKAKINEINNTLAAKNNSKYFQAQTAGSKTNAGTGDDTQKKVNSLLFDARTQEKQGNLAVSLNDYAMVLKLQPGNREAQTGTERLQQAIKNDPAAAKNELVSAIRSFYNSQFDDARRALLEYLESPQTAKNPGVADFYLGATLIERSMLQASRAKWQGPSPEALSAFKAARKANYNPVRNYVSPALLKIWDSTGE